jgi:hypothetical protein
MPSIGISNLIITNFVELYPPICSESDDDYEKTRMLITQTSERTGPIKSRNSLRKNNGASSQARPTTNTTIPKILRGFLVESLSCPAARKVPVLHGEAATFHFFLRNTCYGRIKGTTSNKLANPRGQYLSFSRIRSSFLTPSLQLIFLLSTPARSSKLGTVVRVSSPVLFLFFLLEKTTSLPCLILWILRNPTGIVTSPLASNS